MFLTLISGKWCSIRRCSYLYVENGLRREGDVAAVVQHCGNRRALDLENAACWRWPDLARYGYHRTGMELLSDNVQRFFQSCGPHIIGNPESNDFRYVTCSEKFDGFNTIVSCFSTQILPNQSWYIANTLILYGSCTKYHKGYAYLEL